MLGILVNKTSFGILAGLASAAFLSYCVYFDNKRRSHPDFKKNLFERRRRNRKANDSSGIPNLTDQKSIERYFMQEIHRGELLITEGNYEGGADHLMKAIIVCNKPGKLLSVLQTTLPVEVFALLVNKLNNY
ncbi:hypothetical protein KR222_000700, partial [Zaprionus bogoriensis]